MLLKQDTTQTVGASFVSLHHVTFAATKSDNPEQHDPAMEYVIGV